MSTGTTPGSPDGSPVGMTAARRGLLADGAQRRVVLPLVNNSPDYGVMQQYVARLPRGLPEQHRLGAEGPRTARDPAPATP